MTQQFDNIVGEENLVINNGTYNLRDYPYIIENKTKYFLNMGYSNGNVTYDKQTYYAVSLKYDLWKDLLVYNPENASVNIGVNLIPYKVDSFTIADKKFVNVNKWGTWPKRLNVKGYVQKIKIGNDFILYIKYEKSKSDVLQNDKIYYRYEPDHVFILYQKGRYAEFSSKNDILKLFPEKGDAIENFFEREHYSSPVLFYENLMRYIHKLKN